MSLVSASVVLYKTPEEQLKRVLDSILRSSLKVEVYVVDNSPGPRDCELFHLPGITYIKSVENLGYGAGHNVALGRILDSVDFHFVVNPDISFGPEELEKMIRFMQDNPSVGQLMPKVTYPDGSIQYLCKLVPTPADLFLRRFAVGPFKGFATRRIEEFELRFTGYSQEMDVPYLSGCFMLFRTSALKKIGLFDERFFMYPEDIDITRRMCAEYRTVFFPGATVVHNYARESYKSVRALLVHTANLVKYFNKWGWIYDPERSRLNRQILRQFENQSG